MKIKTVLYKQEETILRITLEEVKNNEEVEQFIQAAQQQIDVLGYTEHAHRHLNIVSQRAGEILRTLRIWWRAC